MNPKVFVNRTLNLKKITYLGLDMDHTLIRYKSENFEALAHKVMLEKLVADKSYPKEVLDLEFDFKRAIRGLVIDIQRGNVLKLSRYAAIRVSFNGLDQIDYGQQKKLYKSTYIDLSDPGYDTVDTTFSIAFAALFGQLVELKNTKLDHILPDPPFIAKDLTEALDSGHRDGSIKDVVTSNPGHFILKDKETVEGLERWKKHGKKVFIVTNSDFHYTKYLLDYAINPFLKEHENWQDLFEYVITSAQKPRFFFDNLKFLKINPQDGTMTNVNGALDPGIYQGGCANVLTSELGLNPDEILYVGDHIYGDIVRLKKDCAWRTALVVEELEDESANLAKASQYSEKINTLMAEKVPLERQVDEMISKKIETGDSSKESKINDLIDQVNKIDHKISPLIKEQQKLFNPYWGEVMRVGIEESFFAYQVERYACIYMAKLADFLACSPRTYFRSQKREMPHELHID